MNLNKRYSMYVGRFQPFHEGHEWLVEEILQKEKRVCIAVMDIHDIEPEKNPYTTKEVVENISKKFKNHIISGLIKVITIPPIESINYGRTVGYDVIEHIPPEEIKKISATNIRRKNDITV